MIKFKINGRKRIMILLIAMFGLLLIGCGGQDAYPTPEEVAVAFRAEGLEAENERPLTAADMGAAPMRYTAGLYIYLPQLGADKGGRVMLFDNETDRDATAGYYEELCRASALFCSRVIKNGRYLVQLNGELTDDIAQKYEIALRKVLGN